MREVPNWSQYFMEIAKTVSIRSKDPNTQVGCIIINNDKHIIGTGFNGFAPEMLETKELWERPTKYDYVVHAEANALINRTGSCKGGSLFSTLYPCKDCAKLIAGSRIKKVYYKEHEVNSRNYFDPISADIFTRCGIEVIKLA